jgi:flavocytochrome c
MAFVYDIIIVGAGSAGMPCAIRAAQRGLSVLVIEKDTEVGGTLHLTAGHLSAAATKKQKEKGIDDNPDSHYADIMRISHNTAIPFIVRLAVDLAPVTVDWLQELGYEIHEQSPVIIYGHEAYSTPRTYFGKDDYAGKEITGSGKAVLKSLLPLWNRLVSEKKIELLTAHLFTEILLKKNKATGIKAKNNGEEKSFLGKNIVLASGGYAANAAFFSQHIKKPSRLLSTASLNSTGDGIIAAMNIGGVFHGAEKHISSLGGVELEPGSGRADFWKAWAKVSNSKDREPWEIYINEEGRRFMNEHDLTVDERERIVMEQSNQRFWAVFDDAALKHCPCIIVQWTAEKLKEESKKEKCCWQADSIEALAEKINIPSTALQQTISTYNNFVENKKDNEFGRTYLQHKISSPPYYAVLIYAYSLISFGGIKVNEKLQVVNRHNQPFENLYAAGEILGAGATSGNAFCGGMLLTPAISFGKYLGETL